MYEKLLRRPIVFVAAIGLITIFFTFQLPRAELDNNNMRFVPKDDEARLTSDYIEDTFGSSFFMLVALEREDGDIFDPAFINRIREFVARMEEIEITDDINSIVSSDYIIGEGDAIIVEKLVGEDFSGTPEEIGALKKRLLSWDMYRRALVSDDFTATQILVPLDVDDEEASRPEVIDSFIEIRDIAKEMFAPYATVYVTGIPIISATINEAMKADLVIMIPLVILVVILVLFFSFRRLSAVVLPVLTVVIAVIWSMGAMPLFGVKLSVISTVLPVILVAVGSAYGIHLVTHYQDDLRSGMSGEEYREMVIDVVRKIGKAVFLAALTTFAGFFSFCFTSVLPIREFGLFSSFGVFASYIVAVTLIPALLLLRGPRPLKAKKKGAAESSLPMESSFPMEPALPAESFEAGMTGFFSAIAGKKRTVLCVTALIVLISIYGVTKVVIDNIFVEYFKTTTDISRSDRFIREKFGGSKVVSVVAQADSYEQLLRPEALGAMDRLGSYLEARVPEVGKVMGFTDLVKRMNQVLYVNESPEGIKPSASAEDPGGFGFGDFGFDNFDFGDFEDEAALPEASASAEAAPIAGEEEIGEQMPVSMADIIGLLNRAAGSGKNRSLSANELIREAERLINYEGMAYYEIPGDPVRYGKTSPEELQRMIAGYLILLSGNIDSYSNDPLEPTAIKTTVQLRALGEADTGRALAEISRFIDSHFPDYIKTLVGGSALVEASLNRLVVQSQLSSVLVSIFLVFLIIAVANKSLVAGIIGIAPLSISILINFAVMGFLGIKLNIGTSMVASVSVGIGIDYTIHYIETYKREYLASGGRGDFLRRTFATSGKAILINAVSVGAGFAVLIFSQFVMLQDLGLLIALTMGASALVSLTVIPVLLTLIKPAFIFGRR
jgi:predicted RND superfamily exporter protein